MDSITFMNKGDCTRNSDKTGEAKQQNSPMLSTGNSTNESSGSQRNRGKNSYRENSDKGKEKEHNVRVRDKDSKRGSGVGGDEDDNDGEGGVEVLHQNLTSGISALQGLLRKLSVKLYDLLLSSTMSSLSASHQSGRLKKILFGLQFDDDGGAILR